ncbi:hypothetical protein GCK32_018136 [Trichostrongylus colubriformis]|uniref:Uncharacterized protein n=2 Tax=Trichostrongylus colubriformis TaxID=6319 RepID=A0AAN8FT01_TRICO
MPSTLQSAFLLQTPASHSTFAATDPGVYNYFPTLIAYLKQYPNYEANFAFIVRTKEAITVLKWFVLCALEKDCMGPPGAQLSCSFSNDRFKQYAKCHRYDQSVINLLLANMYGYNPKNYVSRFGQQGVEIKRFDERSLTAKDFECN